MKVRLVDIFSVNAKKTLSSTFDSRVVLDYEWIISFNE